MPNNSHITLICHSTVENEPEFVVNQRHRCQKFDAYYGEFPIKIVFINKDIERFKVQLQQNVQSFLISGYIILDHQTVPSIVNILAFSNFIAMASQVNRFANINVIGTIIKPPTWHNKWVLTKIMSFGWFNGDWYRNYYQVFAQYPFANQLVEHCPKGRTVQLIGDFKMFTLFDEKIQNMQLFMKMRPFRLNFISPKGRKNK